ncbi:MAG: hypothetical protein ACRCR9_01150 [Chitinophagaceae bacterium]
MPVFLFQCSKCGKQASRSSFPSPSSCPNGGNHVWQKVGRFIKRFFIFGE